MATSVVEMRKPVFAEDDGVREIHGVRVGAYEETVRITEDGDLVRLYAPSGNRHLTPRQARYLARKLYHLARRIERREVGA